MVVLAEVTRKAYLASIVPVIVNAILNEHQIIVDIVAFVNKGDFPRSRLGEKQRGKVLAGWVTRKLRTLAQFAIRDVDAGAMYGEAGPGEGEASNRVSTGSVRSVGGGVVGASSLRNIENADPILEHEEFEQQMEHITDMEAAEAPMGMGDEDEKTPTGFPPSFNEHNRFRDVGADNGHQGSSNADDYEYADQQHHPGYGQQHQDYNAEHQNYNQGYDHGYGMERFSTPNPPEVGPKPTSSGGQGHGHGHGQVPPAIRLPGVDGREDIDFWGGKKDDEEEDNWEADAIMHMNLAGDMGNR